MTERLEEWWEELDEVERSMWVMSIALAFAAVAGVVIRALVELR